MHRRTAVVIALLVVLGLAGCSGGTERDRASSAYAALLSQAPAGFEIDAPRLAAGMAATEARRQAAEAQQAAEGAAAAEAARAEAAAAAAAAAAAGAAAAEAARSNDDECIGYGCSPEQDAEINEAERAANDDYGPGCDFRLCGDQGFEFPPFACDAGPDGLPVCEGDVPASVGPYHRPDGTLVGG
jgi:hypothetical protein